MMFITRVWLEIELFVIAERVSELAVKIIKLRFLLRKLLANSIFVALHSYVYVPLSRSRYTTVSHILSVSA